MEKNDITADIESVIAQVQGVSSSRVVCNGKEVVEVHVLANGSRPPKQIVRDIESAVLVKLGITVDHKRISVAQLGQDEAAPDYPNHRLRLTMLNYATNGRQVTVSTTVTINDQEFTAAINGPAVMKNRLRLVAGATLAAVEQYLGGGPRFMVDDVQKITLAGQEVVIVVVSLFTDTGDESLLGTALVRGDDRESTAKATLDAVNRRLVVIAENE